jgi:hypothetical protein
MRSKQHLMGRRFGGWAALNSQAGRNWSVCSPRAYRTRAANLAIEEASYRVAKQAALEIPESGKDRLLPPRALALLRITAGYPARPAVLGCLDDDVHVAPGMGGSDRDIRLQLTKALTEFAAA